MNTALIAIACLAVGQAEASIKVQETENYVLIETDALQAKINKKGYVSGIAAGSFLDKKTGSRDAGFGLHIMDFLLGPGYKDGDDYARDKKYHGDLPKHYVEGPQICTQAKQLDPEIIKGDGFVAVRMSFKFTKGHNGFKPGSLWTQTLVFQPKVRYIISSESITSVNDVDNLLYRIDMPGHVKHKNGDTFEQIYLSYHGKIAAKEFAKDFAPDDKFLYQRPDSPRPQGEGLGVRGKLPERMIRAYQLKRDRKTDLQSVLGSGGGGDGLKIRPAGGDGLKIRPTEKLKRDGKPGPWIAGMTLDPAVTVEAWCHQRGYVCFIQELHGRKVKAGETFGAAYVVGYFDDIAAMEKTYDRHKGARSIQIDGKQWRLK